MPPVKMLRWIFILLYLIHFGSSTTPSVVVIGAGPSGIAAATKLYQNNFKNVKVLEAENRIGGRVNSVKFGDAFVDIGAEYCHGEQDNAVYQFAKDFDVLAHVRAEEYSRFYYSNGSKIDYKLGVEILAFAFAYDSLDSKVEDSPVSSGDDFLRKYNSSLLHKYEDDNVMKSGIRYSESLIRMTEGAFSWFDSLAKPLKHYQKCEGDQFMTWKGCGYRMVLDIMMRAYPNSDDKLDVDILLNKTVNKIKYEDHVHIECEDGSSFEADHVIFTPSIGVLKARHSDLFTPKLPKTKKDAINAIGFGGVMKVILHFERPWWKADDLSFSLFWSEADLQQSLERFPEGPNRKGKSWITEILALVRVQKNPNVLIAWLTSDLVPEIEQLSAEDLQKGFGYVIEKFLGKDYNVTVPDQIIWSKWVTNKNFRGTYSFERQDAYRENVWYQKDLAEPLNNKRGVPVVLFAGEATNPIHYSTVHGAIETGLREADRIIHLYNNNTIL